MVVAQENVRAASVLTREGVILWRKPARPLPAVNCAEHGAAGCHPVVARRALQRPRGNALLVRIVHGKDIGVGFLSLGLEVAASRIGSKAARIDAQHIDGRLAIDDRLAGVAASSLPPAAVTPKELALVEPEVRQVPKLGPTISETIGASWGWLHYRPS